MSGAFTTEIPVRYSDVDTYGHVNNATYATYLEEARIDYLEALLEGEDLTSTVDSETDDDATEDEPTDDATDRETGTDADDALGMVVANLDIDFLRPIESADAVTVTVGIGTIGRSSFTLEYEVRSETGTHATADTTMVAFDRDERESRPLPDRWRRAIEEFEGIEAE